MLRANEYLLLNDYRQTLCVLQATSIRLKFITCRNAEDCRRTAFALWLVSVASFVQLELDSAMAILLSIEFTFGCLSFWLELTFNQPKHNNSACRLLLRLNFYRNILLLVFTPEHKLHGRKKSNQRFLFCKNSAYRATSRGNLRYKLAWPRNVASV